MDVPLSHCSDIPEPLTRLKKEIKGKSAHRPYWMPTFVLLTLFIRPRMTTGSANFQPGDVARIIFIETGFIVINCPFEQRA